MLTVRPPLRSVFVIAALLGGCASVSSDAPAPSLDPARFIGSPAGALERVIGSPDFVRAEGLGALRRYDGETCALLVVTEGSGDDAAVRAISAGPRIAGDPAPDAALCLGALSVA